MVLRIAVKRLSAVETDPDRSHQHEFHAGNLRRELELGEEPVSGRLSTLIFAEGATSPVVDEATFTLYDARASNPARAAEWRLFYSSEAIPRLARPGDLLLIYRQGLALHALIAQHGSRVERDLLEALSVGDDAVRERFSFLDASTPDEREARSVASQLSLPTPVQPASHYEVADHALFRRAVHEGRLPATQEMATAAGEIVAVRGTVPVDPDDFLITALEAETELYFGIETEVQTTRLAALLATTPSITDVIDFALAVQQSRRSRRGQSLQNHFARVLDMQRIPYSAQCKAEEAETPDFVVPGCDQYHDATYPAGKLRMVACKSTAKERWRQVLHEAARIPDKYLLTLDPDLTEPTIRAMGAARVRAFLPRQLLRGVYSNHPAVNLLGSVGDLVVELRAVV